MNFDVNDLLNNIVNNVKEDIKTFDDVVNLDGSLKRELYLYDINEGTGSSLDGFIRFWNKYDDEHNIPVKDREPIKLYIDSCGGDMCETFIIIDAVKLSKTPIITICTGSAYSGGFFVFICGSKRIAYPHSSFLFHEGSTGTSGTAGQFENYTAFYKRQLEQLKNVVIENTNISEEEYKDIRKDDVWYTAEDGVEKGFVDEIAKELV